MCNNKTRLTLFSSDRVVDHQVRLQTDIRDPSGEGSCVRVANHLHPRETARSSGRRYGPGDHPVQLSRLLSKWLPSLRPWPCKCWHQRRGWGRLSHVLCQFLGAGLVPRSVILEWSDNDKSIIMYYYIIIASLLHIIKSIITCYYIIVTSLLRHYYAIIAYYYIHYYLLLQIHYYVLLHHYYVIITSLLRHYYVIITSLLHHYYSLLHHYYSLLQVHYYILLHHYFNVIT